MTIWAIIPAAGQSQRMNHAVRKPYLPLNKGLVIEYSIKKLLEYVEKMVVVLAPEDSTWSTLALSQDKRITTTLGGAKRGLSVYAGLQQLSQDCPTIQADDWVMIHDAARPCLQAVEIERLITTCHQHPVGGILALPVTDTLKYSQDTKTIAKTFDRTHFWLAQTPQMLRYGLLKQELDKAVRDNELAYTDEASLVEAAGYYPQLVRGHAHNIKVTYPEDLVLAEKMLTC